MKVPVVSILTPVYKGERFIGHAIASALRQTYSHIELVIVNDGSPDTSAEVIRPFLSDPRVKYIEQTNSGVAAARNTALAYATGDYVGFLDQDDEWLPDKLALQVSFLQSHPDIALVHGRQVSMDDSGSILDRDFINIEAVSGHCFPLLFDKNRIAVLTVLARRSAITEAGGFNPRASRADDYELWLRIALKHPIGFIEQPVARYRVHGDNASHDAFRMTIADLTAIESVMADLPGVREAVTDAAIRTRLYDLHWQLGNWHMWKHQDFKKACDHFRKAIHLRPLSRAAWRRLLWCSLSPQQRRTLAWWGTRLGLGDSGQ